MIRWIELNDRKISYRIKGSGRTLVMLHGFLMSSATWGAFFEQLSYSYKVLAPDFPGHGISDFSPPSNSMDLMADSVSKILEAEKIDSFFLLGHSMGAYVALSIFERYPEKIVKLLLLNSHPFADTPEKIKIRHRAINVINTGRKDLFLHFALKELFPYSDPEAFDSILSETLSTIASHTAESISATIEGMKSRPDRSSLLKNPNIPIKWIMSVNDNQFDAKVFSDLAKNLGIVSPQTIEGGHMSFIENPDFISSCVKDFMQ